MTTLRGRGRQDGYTGGQVGVIREKHVGSSFYRSEVNR